MYNPYSGWELVPERYSVRNMLIYTWRRATGQFRSFPEVKGMGYNKYRKTYLRVLSRTSFVPTGPYKG